MVFLQGSGFSFDGGTRILRVIHGRDARATSIRRLRQEIDGFRKSHPVVGGYGDWVVPCDGVARVLELG